MDRRTFIFQSSLTAAGVLAGASACGTEDLDAAPLVETLGGPVQGVRQDGVQAFRGIPYAAATSGEARFLPPAPRDPWTQVFDATRLGPRCGQWPSGLIPEIAATEDTSPMSEDCLRLNVWTPVSGDPGSRPVMVWLHGGGFWSGSGGFSIYDGAGLASSEDVVVVTLNHRLNAFGFLYLPELGGSRFAEASNVGMLDIVAALGWVRDNVAAFGGDPRNVTIFGQSGGAGKVSTLMAMPAARGLFHKAIIQSGSTVRGMDPAGASAEARRLVEALGLTSADALTTLGMDALLTGAQAQSLSFAPVVDGRTLPTHPFDPTAPALSADIPVLIGSTETEVAFRAGEQLDPIEDADLTARVSQTADVSAADAARLIDAYRQGRPGLSNIDLHLILASDASFRRGVMTEAERKADQNGAPVFMYYVTWRSPVRDGKLKSFHTVEIPLVFNNVEAGASMVGSASGARTMAETMSGAWAAFARSGNPSTPKLGDWPAFDTLRRTTMILDSESRIVGDPNGNERRLLDDLMTS